MPSGRIMIVEDESLVAEDLRSCLVRAGYEVVGIADNFDAAQQLAQQSRPDLALLDIRLKGTRDGIELATALREQKVGFVFLTSHSDEGTLARAERTAPLGYVLKPFGAREMFPVLQTALYRHAAELRLRGMEQWLQTTLRSIGDGVVVTDADGMVTFMNPMAERMSQCLLPDASGRSLTDVMPLLDTQTGRPLPCMATRAMRLGGTVHLDPGINLLRPDGTALPVDDSAAPVRNDTGDVTGAVLVLQDATPRRLLEQRRREAEQRMLSAQKLESLSVLAGGLAHDLNNILTRILGGISLCRDGDVLQSQHALRGMESAAREAAELCQRMLAGSGAAPVQLQCVDVGGEVVTVVEALRAETGSRIEYIPRPERSGLRVLADAAQLRQVLDNLVRNAVEAMGERGGSVSIRWGELVLPCRFVARASSARSLPPGEYVWIEVADDGPGMTKDVLARIFEPFFTTKLNGRGLGLASVHGIVRRHGGTIDAESEHGLGTWLRVYWPRATQNGEPPPAAVRSMPERREVADRVQAGPGVVGLALLVDDDEGVRRTCSRLLQARGWKCREAIDGEAALALLGAGLRPDVVLLDRQLPGSNGDQILAQIRRQYPTLPVLMVSGGAGFRLPAIQDDRVGFLAKPFSGYELDAELWRLCGKAPRGDAGDGAGGGG